MERNIWNCKILFHVHEKADQFSREIMVKVDRTGEELQKIIEAARDCYNIQSDLEFILLLVKNSKSEKLQQSALHYISKQDRETGYFQTVLHIKVLPVNFFVKSFYLVENFSFSCSLEQIQSIAHESIVAIKPRWSEELLNLSVTTAAASTLQKLRSFTNSFFNNFSMEIYTSQGALITSAASMEKEGFLLVNIKTANSQLIESIQLLNESKDILIHDKAYDDVDGNDYGLSTSTAAVGNPLTSQQQLLEAQLSSLGFNVSKDVISELWRIHPDVERAISYFFEHPELMGSTNDPPDLTSSFMMIPSAEEEEEELSLIQDGEQDYIEVDDFQFTIPPNLEEDSSDEEEEEYFDCNNDTLDSDMLGPNDAEHASSTPYEDSNNHQTSSEATLLQRLHVKLGTTCGVNLNEAQLQELYNRYPLEESFESLVNFYLNNEEYVANISMDSHPDSNFDDMVLEDIRDAVERSEIAQQNADYELNCPLCLDDVSISQMYTLQCDPGHMYCYRCLYRYIRVSVMPQEDSAPHIPACPNANGTNGCRYVLRETEIEQIIDACTQVGTICSWEEGQRLMKKISQLYLMRAMRGMNCVRCPCCPADDESECYWVARPEATVNATGRTSNNDNTSNNIRAKVDCPTCGAEFCSACLRSPYHYRYECHEIVNYSRAWLDWVGGGRDQYLREWAGKSEAYTRQFEDYNRRIQEHQREVTAAQARFDELKANEEHFARVCKRCPHCNAAVERIEGCDSMVCGRDYHGGNVSNSGGCGKAFNWSTAPTYIPNTGEAKTPAELNVVAPEQAQEIQHFITAEFPLRCDDCHEPIVGPCIQCINCPSFNLCLGCSSTKEYPEYAREHSHRHICTVIFDSKE